MAHEIIDLTVGDVYVARNDWFNGARVSLVEITGVFTNWVGVELVAINEIVDESKGFSTTHDARWFREQICAGKLAKA